MTAAKYIKLMKKAAKATTRKEAQKVLRKLDKYLNQTQ